MSMLFPRQLTKRKPHIFSQYCLAAAITFLIFSNTAQAQVLYGSLTGTVMDPSNAMVPGATIEALNVGTQGKWDTTTNPHGVYLFNLLPPGLYKVTVAAQGFKSQTTDNIRITANSTQRTNFKLDIGETVDIITIEAGLESLFQTERADVSTNLNAAQINNLPITSSLGRNVQVLYKLVPGFSIITEGISSDGGNPQRSMTANVNGNSTQANLTRIDGASNTYIWLPFNTAYIPPTESIDSANIVTNSFDAEQGGQGAAINITTKSGANELHGSVFEFHTDNALKTLNRFNPSGFRKPKYILNQLGGSVGGPILKNKLFFFSDWEGTRRRMLASSTKTVINPAAIFDLNGNADLSDAIPEGADCNTNPIAGCLFDPNTGNPDGTGRIAFTGNRIPAGRISPAAKTMLSRINPKGFLNNDGINATDNYNSTGSAKLDRDTVDAKIDFLPDSKTTLFGRYSISQTMLFDPPVLGDAMGGATGGGQVGQAPSRIQNIGLGLTRSITPMLQLDLNFGYTRQRLGAEHAPDLDLGNYGSEVLGIPGANGNNRLAQGTPAFLINLWNPIGNSNTGNPFKFRDNQYVVNANLGWMKGRHNFRAGIEHTRSGINHFQPQGGTFQTPRGSFRFTGNVTALYDGPSANKANSLAQFLLGFPDEAGKAVQNANPNSLRFRTWSFYIKDRWQLTSKLTVNYGLRWEYFPLATSDHGGVRLFNPETGNVLICGHGQVPMDCGVDVGSGQWLPRFGLAYSLAPKLVIRGGYGMNADSNNWRFFRNNYPATTNSTVTGNTSYYPAASLTEETLTPYPGLQAGIPSVQLPDISSGIIPLPDNVNPGNTIPFKYHRGYIHSYNVTLQTEVAGAVVEAAYVGTRGVRTLNLENINPAPLGGGNAGRILNVAMNRNWGDIMAMVPDTNSYYDSFQLKASRRFAGTSNIGLTYTLSKALNSGDNEEVPATLSSRGGHLFWAYPEYRSRNKALASFDRTHNLTIYGNYDFPFGANKRWAQTGPFKTLGEGWQLNWILSRLSGDMLTLIGGGAHINAPGNEQTADQISPIHIPGNAGPIPGSGAACAPTDKSCHYFDPTSFRAVPSDEMRFGTTGRNILRGPGFFNLDASLFRNFRLSERVTFQFRMEVFGVTNTPHLGNPGTDVTNPSTFGVITSTLNLAGRGTGSGGERQFRFAGKVMF
jgi:hypothetical protein